MAILKSFFLREEFFFFFFFFFFSFFWFFFGFFFVSFCVGSLHELAVSIGEEKEWQRSSSFVLSENLVEKKETPKKKRKKKKKKKKLNKTLFVVGGFVS